MPVSFADADTSPFADHNVDQGPGISAIAAVEFPDTGKMHGRESVSSAQRSSYHEQLFWIDVFPRCFSYFENIVGSEIARCNAPDREAKDN